VLPRGPKQLWDTEISWDSNPPDPQGVPIQTHARGWVEQAMYELWRQGVNRVLWLEIGDAPAVSNYASTYQAGMYYLDGQPKPAASAFRFPFVTQRLNRNHVQAWGRAPAGGKLTFELRQGDSWKALRTLNVSQRGVFEATLGLAGKAVLQAQVGGQTSLTWTQSK
jgi:hypothetical protein